MFCAAVMVVGEEERRERRCRRDLLEVTRERERERERVHPVMIQSGFYDGD